MPNKVASDVLCALHLKQVRFGVVGKTLENLLVKLSERLNVGQ